MSAAGALGLMKIVLAVEHGVVPPNLHFTGIPDKLAPVKTNLFVPQTVIPWPGKAQGPRRAGVSAYGMSGSNVHAVVEQAPPVESSTAAAVESPLGSQLIFPVSSTSAEELRRTAARLADWVAERPEVTPGDVGYTLARRRAHRSVRTAVVAHGADELIDAARRCRGRRPVPGRRCARRPWPGVVVLGSGVAMGGHGCGITGKEPVFAETIARLEPLIHAESGFGHRRYLGPGDRHRH